MNETLNCPVCGYQYESSPEGACGPCPLHTDCAMACCPACGHTTINTEKSSLVQMFTKWFSPSQKNSAIKNVQPLKVHVGEDEIAYIPREASRQDPENCRTLDDIAPGEVINVESFGTGLSLQHQLRLQAFGLEPGQSLAIIQQHPVTIVKIDHTELAVERYLAHQIFVD